MTKLIFDHEEEMKTDIWTRGRLQDEFFLALTRVRISKVDQDYLEDKKYYSQAIQKIYKIPLTERFPKYTERSNSFIINISDLPKKVQKDFKKYCSLNDKREIALFLKEIVVRLFENVNYEYTHMSVIRKMRIVLEP